MKVTHHEVIKNGEQELIDAITADLDWSALEAVFRKEHNLKIEENVEYKKGDIVIYNNQIAYKLDFDVSVVLSVLLDREGNYISVSTPTAKDHIPEDNDDSEVSLSMSNSADPDDKILELTYPAGKTLAEPDLDMQDSVH